jgi:hypothetical protein
VAVSCLFVTIAVSQETEDPSMVFVNCPAQYPEGNQGLKQFLMNAIDAVSFPEEAILIGHLYLRLTISSFGKVEQATVVNSKKEIVEGIDLTLFLNMPDWIPACDAAGKPIQEVVVIPLRICYQ